MPREDYEARKEARIERYEDRASAANERSNAAYKASLAATAGIPMGQPILVGHHSEKLHRAALAKSDAGMRKSIGESSKAAHYASKAAAAESNTAISSDDPEAVVKMREKISVEVAKRDADKAANKLLRKAKLKVGEFSPAEVLAAVGERYKPQAIRVVQLAKVGCLYGEFAKIPGYEISNRTANIKRMEGRLADLERSLELAAEAEEAGEDKTTEYDGIEVVENTGENRVQMIFPGKPSDEIRSILKSNGFRWSRYNGAWQRHLNSSGRYAAERVAKLIEGTKSS